MKRQRIVAFLKPRLQRVPAALRHVRLEPTVALTGLVSLFVGCWLLLPALAFIVLGVLLLVSVALPAGGKS